MKELIYEELAKGGSLSIVTLVNLLIAFADECDTSDIHIDPGEKAIRIRFRIDGELLDMLEFPNSIQAEIISRIKVVAHLRTDEHQAPQDGRFKIATQKRLIDIRVSIMPTYHGENAVLRLLRRTSDVSTLDSLGFSENEKERVYGALKSPHGMIVATGPTGSGKTTTLYALLSCFAEAAASVVTIEDPVEYAMNGIEQIQVNYHSGLTFSNGLRSILRQDPNVIMVGEIRDKDTAAISVNAALTGHLLFSTLHTNSAAATIPRLFDMGVDPYLIASTLRLIIAQRLVRKICDGCKKVYPLSSSERAYIKRYTYEIEDALCVYRGSGCEACNGTGYKGRIIVSETLILTSELREAIVAKAGAEKIQEIAETNGMKTLAQDGFKKILAGQTTIEEIVRILHEYHP